MSGFMEGIAWRQTALFPDGFGDWIDEGHLVPDRKTIADFRRDRGSGIRRSCACFVKCAVISAFSRVRVSPSIASLVQRRQQLGSQLSQGQDRQPHSPPRGGCRTLHPEMVPVDWHKQGEVWAKQFAYLEKRFGPVRKHIQHLQTIDRALADATDGQIWLTDRHTCAMATSTPSTGKVYYNVQTAVVARLN